jgi:hypothetical protein
MKYKIFAGTAAEVEEELNKSLERKGGVRTIGMSGTISNEGVSYVSVLALVGNPDEFVQTPRGKQSIVSPITYPFKQ